MSWWRTSRGRSQALIAAFGVLALFGILIGAFNVYSRGDQRVLVVTLQQGVSDADRATLKDACGSLPGVSLVADRGAQERQYRFPVRFQIGGTTPEQEAALEGCIARYPQLVRGVLTEGDAT